MDVFPEISTKITCRIAGTFFILFCYYITIVMAADKEQEVFNQLYKEIINSSPNVILLNKDSMDGRTILHYQGMCIDSIQSSNTGCNPHSTSDRLMQEIDKIIQDTKIRNQDAVKFMQDSK